MSERSLGMAYAMKKRMAKGGAQRCAAHGEAGCQLCMAEGGGVGEGEKASYVGKVTPSHNDSEGYGTHRSAGGGTSYAGEYVRKGDTHRAKVAHAGVSAEMRAMRGKDRKNLAEGGEVEDEDDLVSRAMRRRMAEGGMIANDDEPIADGEEAQYDDLVKDDDLEADYPGRENIGDERLEEDDRDVVSRIMRSRSKKDRMPRPA